MVHLTHSLIPRHETRSLHMPLPSFLATNAQLACSSRCARLFLRVSQSPTIYRRLLAKRTSMRRYEKINIEQLHFLQLHLHFEHVCTTVNIVSNYSLSLQLSLQFHYSISAASVSVLSSPPGSSVARAWSLDGRWDVSPPAARGHDPPRGDPGLDWDS